MTIIIVIKPKIRNDEMFADKNLSIPIFTQQITLNYLKLSN